MSQFDPTPWEDQGTTRASAPRAGRSALNMVLVFLGVLLAFAGGIIRLASEDVAPEETTAVAQYGWVALIVVGFVLILVGVRRRNRSLY